MDDIRKKFLELARMREQSATEEARKQLQSFAQSYEMAQIRHLFDAERAGYRYLAEQFADIAVARAHESPVYGEAQRAMQAYSDEMANYARASTSLSSLSDHIRRMEDYERTGAALRASIPSIVIPTRIRHLVDQLDVDGRFIGEFPHSDPDILREDDLSNASAERQEVESRIILVEHFPQRVFDAIKSTPDLMRGLEPRQFEEFIAELLARLGFSGVQITPRSGDGGRDIIATKEIHQIPIVMAFECKRYGESQKIGPDILRALLGTITHRNSRASMGVLITTSSFTKGAKKFMAAESSINGKDFAELAFWLSQLPDSRSRL